MRASELTGLPLNRSNADTFVPRAEPIFAAAPRIGEDVLARRFAPTADFAGVPGAEVLLDARSVSVSFLALLRS